MKKLPTSQLDHKLNPDNYLKFQSLTGWFFSERFWNEEEQALIAQAVKSHISLSGR